MPRENPSNMDATLTLGDGVAVIRRHGRSDPMVAGVLGIQHAENGEPERVYLDRLIHSPYHRTMGEWQISGAVSTILSRVAPKPEKAAAG